MAESRLFSLLLIKRLSPQTDRMIESVESIRTEPEAVLYAEQRAGKDRPGQWTHCAIIRPNGEFRHGIRREDHIVWDVMELP